jgi:hypothetical protein
MRDDGDPRAPWPFWWSDPRIRIPTPPGGFRRPRKPKAAGGRRRQREAETAQLRLAGIFRAGTAVIGAAVVVVAILVIALIIAEH